MSADLPQQTYSNEEGALPTPELPTGHRQRVLGSIYTPKEYAELLVTHGVRSKDDRVLDIGVGGRGFTLAAYDRLVQLGASETQAEQQIYGTEIDEASYQRFVSTAEAQGRRFPNVRRQDFFRTALPEFNAVIGNPPYVRRTYLEDVDHIRDVVSRDLFLQGQQRLRRSTDLYIYFLLRAATLLRPGGTLSIITADPWLSVNYGEAFKQHLLRNFEIKTLISFDRRVFQDAEVKPVLLMAERRSETRRETSPAFVRVRNGLPVTDLQRRLQTGDFAHADINVIRVEQKALDAQRPWAVHFKAGAVYDRIASHRLMAPLKDVAYTSIGVQTLAKAFFVLTPAQAQALGIEDEYLRPLANSNRTHGSPVIAEDQEPEHLVFYCNKDSAALTGTHALAYIKAGESTPVPVRGKGTTVTGYQHKERIQHARRKHWYDLKTLMEKRGCAKILLPRLVYSTFRVVWNKAGFIPGELFIEVKPYSENIDVRVFLAILNSAPTEVALRVHAQLYGGGTFNINPGPVKLVPVLDPRKLSPEARQELVVAYERFLSDPAHDITPVNTVVFRTLDMTETEMYNVLSVLNDLRHSGHAAKVLQHTRYNQDEAPQTEVE